MQNEVGKGAFQECDQLAAVEGHVKWAGQAATAADIPRTIAQAFQVGVWLRGFGGLLALSVFVEIRSCWAVVCRCNPSKWPLRWKA